MTIKWLLARIVTETINQPKILMNQYTLRRFFKRHFSGRRVAIVGGSPDLLGSKKGAYIESHDIVVRINFNNPEGFIGCLAVCYRDLLKY
jgi:hypothetical protein